MNTLHLQKLKQPSYLFREALNQLKSNIEFSGGDVQTILITSVNPNEGKSLISFELARSFAEEGKQVCYVDADLRKSVFTTRYQVVSDEKFAGLSSLLSKTPGAAASICKTNISNLDVIPAGRITPDPSALFKTDRMNQLLGFLKDHYDYVIIDIAPLGVVIDAAIVAPKCDGTVIVVANNITSARAAKRIKLQLEMANARILGVVFNKATVNKDKYYHYYGEYKL